MFTHRQYVPAGRNASEISTDVETAIREGRLRPGEVLPPVRTLAADLGLSPATVASAYRDLRAKGIARGERRAGTRITGAPPTAPRPPLVVPAGVRNLVGGAPDPALLPDVPPAGRGHGTGRSSPGAGSPGPGSPGAGSRSGRSPGRSRRHPAAFSPRLYDRSPVSPRLAGLAAERLATDGIDPANLAVVGGALDGVERVVGAWLRPGDRVAIEDPGYPPLHDLLAALDLTAEPVAIDENGVRPQSLARALSGGRCQAAVLVPRAQSPTGAAWDAERARDIASALDASPDVLVIEDDHAGEVAGPPPRTVTADRRRWAVIRSVSKSLGPDLRLAVLAGDAVTVARVEGRQALGTGWVSYLLQDIVADLWADPAVAALLAQARDTYTERRERLISDLAAVGILATGRSGMAVWIPVTDEAGATSGLLDRGWAVAPGARFRIASPPAIRVGIATLTAEESGRLAADLAACLRRRPRRTD